MLIAWTEIINQQVAFVQKMLCGKQKKVLRFLIVVSKEFSILYMNENNSTEKHSLTARLFYAPFYIYRLLKGTEGLNAEDSTYYTWKRNKNK